ncbi:unnamed protein product [Allacma fusca]|uniref:Uncharacterized protein n=1 Tax=Allacma fusca TaxID=39272 RepID=A0A8J2JYI8_9HEXA|nr:unnamed protein product [Allacma fusca]
MRSVRYETETAHSATTFRQKERIPRATSGKEANGCPRSDSAGWGRTSANCRGEGFGEYKGPLSKLRLSPPAQL